MLPTQLLVLSFIIKLLSRINIFNNIREKHGNETVRLCRQLEKSITKRAKIKLDLDFLLKCKKENLIPTFAKPKLSIPSDKKLQSKIAKLLIKTELKNKHEINKKLRKKVQEYDGSLKTKLGFFNYFSFKYKISNTVALKVKNGRKLIKRNC